MHPHAPPPPSSALTLMPSPPKILAQIALVQISHYALATTLLLFATLAAGRPFSLSVVLDWRAVRGDTAVGWTLALCWGMAGWMGALTLLVLVSRSKLVLDFALTAHALHLLATSVYSRAPPGNWLWWGAQVASAGGMWGLGVWACRWRELRPISFGGRSGGRGKGDARDEGDGGGGGDNGAERDDEEVGVVSQGRGRGKNRGGEYEMVGIKEGA